MPIQNQQESPIWDVVKRETSFSANSLIFKNWTIGENLSENIAFESILEGVESISHENTWGKLFQVSNRSQKCCFKSSWVSVAGAEWVRERILGNEVSKVAERETAKRGPRWPRARPGSPMVATMATGEAARPQRVALRAGSTLCSLVNVWYPRRCLPQRKCWVNDGKLFTLMAHLGLWREVRRTLLIYTMCYTSLMCSLCPLATRARPAREPGSEAAQLIRRSLLNQHGMWAKPAG